MSETLIRLHNSKSRAKEDFVPIDPENVRMYVCGPTVYDRAHLGNARPVVVFDTLYRLLRHVYGGDHVTYVRNFTDVDDKINATALARKEAGAAGTLEELIAERTEETISWYHQDMDALGTLRPTQEPRATAFIGQMVAMIADLIEKGHAYAAEGHVLFSVESYKAYGALSGRSVDDMIAGARVEVAPYKKDPADFVLWKPSTDDLPGWDSPWGRGRPGWHLECSVMSEKFLSPEFDIHGGGQDLIFPHHENEIAQSTCTGDAGFAKYWMHNGYLMAEGEKMSKSLGNFYTVHDLLGEFPGEAIRLALLKTHYRQPLDFTKAGIEEAKRELDGFYGALRGVDGDPAVESKTPDIIEALSDDLNTPLALSHLHELAGGLNKAAEDGKPEAARLLKAAGEFLGLLQQDPEAWFKGEASEGGLDDDAIDALIAERTQARADKDFERGDEIRDELEAQGILLEDGDQGTTWKRK